MPPVGFEPTIPAGERLHIYALDRAATGTGAYRLRSFINIIFTSTSTTSQQNSVCMTSIPYLLHAQLIIILVDFITRIIFSDEY